MFRVIFFPLSFSNLLTFARWELHGNYIHGQCKTHTAEQGENWDLRVKIHKMRYVRYFCKGDQLCLYLKVFAPLFSRRLCTETTSQLPGNYAFRLPGFDFNCFSTKTVRRQKNRKWFESRSYMPRWNLIVRVKEVLRSTVASDWSQFQHPERKSLHSEDDFSLGCWNVGRYQQSFSGLRSPELKFHRRQKKLKWKDGGQNIPWTTPVNYSNGWQASSSIKRNNSN